MMRNDEATTHRPAAADAVSGHRDPPWIDGDRIDGDGIDGDGEETARFPARRLLWWAFVLVIGVLAVLAVWQEPLHAVG